MTNIKNSNIPILDSLRAFAAISVCLFHFVCTTIGYIETQWVLDSFSIGKYGVQLFFVISGFIIPWSMYQANFKLKNIFKFALKRLTRLEPPYIISIVLALLILFVRENFLNVENNHIAVSFNQVFLHFGYLIPFFENYQWLNPVYWTLAIEFQYYFFIALLFLPLINSNLVYRILVGLCIAGLSFVGNEKFLFYWLPVFYIGILTFLFKIDFIKKREFYLSLFFLLSFCFYKYPIASVIYMAIPVIAILFFTNYKIAVFNFFGKMSYSIYLIHPLIGASIINLLSHHYYGTFSKILVILTGLVVTLISSYIMYLVVENPSKKLSASIKYDNRIFSLLRN